MKTLFFFLIVLLLVPFAFAIPASSADGANAGFDLHFWFGLSLSLQIPGLLGVIVLAFIRKPLSGRQLGWLAAVLITLILSFAVTYFLEMSRGFVWGIVSPENSTDRSWGFFLYLVLVGSLTCIYGTIWQVKSRTRKTKTIITPLAPFIGERSCR